MHGALDAVLDLQQRHALRPEMIEHVQIGLAPATLRTVGLPEERKRQPQSSVDGQFSVHFCTAVILTSGRLSWDAYRDQLHDPDIRALMQRISAAEDPRPTAAYPEQLAGAATFRTRAGQRFDTFVPIPRGEPEHMLAPADLQVKFTSLVGPYLSRQAQTALFDTIMQLDRGATPSDLFRWAAPSQGDSA
jgi:2-methylcitrate dehydratase PrpD